MATEGNDTSEGRPSAPRRITLQGRTFGKLSLGALIGSRDDLNAERDSTSTVARTSGAQRITGARRSAG